MAHGGQRRGQLLQALRHPQQRAHRIAQRRRLDKALQDRASSVASVAVSCRGARRRRGEPGRAPAAAHRGPSAAIDRDRASPVIVGDRREAAPSRGPRLARREQPSCRARPASSRPPPTAAESLAVSIMPTQVAARAIQGNPSTPSHSAAGAATANCDSLIVAAVLSQSRNASDPSIVRVARVGHGIGERRSWKQACRQSKSGSGTR